MTASQSPESGSAAVEFAISVIVLVVLIFGCIGVAMAFYTYEVINQYARDASRYAIVHGKGCIKGDGTSCDIGIGGSSSSPAGIALLSYLNGEIFPGINGNNLTITPKYAKAPGATACSTSPSTDCNGAGDQVTVDVSYQYLYNIPFIPQRLITMHGTSTMIISQ